MNIKITHSWLLEYLDTKATPAQIQEYLSLCGPSVERIEKTGGDWIYEIEITSNRIDTVSVVGIAREAAAILNRFNIPARFKPPQIKTPASNPILPFVIADPKHLCNRLMAVVMDQVTVLKSPEYIKNRLVAAGIRSLNNLVDITNYVMLEIGHPSHVFDYDRIKTNNFLIRHAKAGEKITTLDEKTYDLYENDIIIDDGTGRVIDLPGIMGTANSIVTDQTKKIVFFIESNNSVAIRRSSMTHGIRTLAASINEKYPDISLVQTALYRGIELFETLANAKIASRIFDIYPSPRQNNSVNVGYRYLCERIGVDIPKNQVNNILKDLGFGIRVKENIIEIDIPSYRTHDVRQPEDIVEEIARIYGYHNIPSQLPPLVYLKQPEDTERLFQYQQIIKTFLKHNGCIEVMNYSACSRELLDSFNLRPDRHLKITNTISEDIKYLRQSLIPSLSRNIKDNEGYRPKLKFFEIAKTYLPADKNLPEEKFKIGCAVNTSFEDLKGLIDGLMNELNIKDVQFKAGKNPVFAPAMAGEILIGKTRVGFFGKIASIHAARLRLKSDVFAFELDFTAPVSNARLMPAYKPFSPFANIHLDLTVVHSRPFAEIVKIAKQKAAHLVDITLKDAYKNNLTLHLVFASLAQNLTEKEAQKELEQIKKTLSGDVKSGRS